MKEQAFLRLVERADRRFFAEAASRLAAPERFAQMQKGNGRIMGQKSEHKRHFTGKYVWGGIGIAAALLCAGGITAAVAMHGKPDFIVQSSTPDVIEIGKMDNPAMHGLAASEHGLYYYEGGMRYYDFETGESVWLCTAANCLHDESPYCVATTAVYSNFSDPVWYDGAVYAAALKPKVPGGIEGRGVLLRYEADGSAVTEVAELLPEMSMFDDKFTMIQHGDMFWISVKVGDILQSDDLDTSFIHLNGYYLLSYDPQNKQLCTLSEMEMTDSWSGDAPRNLIGYGDAVYFLKTGDNDWRDPMWEGIYRINCETGEIEPQKQLKNSMPYGASFSGFFIAADRMVVLWWDSSGNHLSYFDMKTGAEMSQKNFKEEIFDSSLADLTDRPYYFPALLADSERVYLDFALMPTAENRQETEYFIVTDWEGNVQQTVEIPAAETMLADTDMMARFRSAYQKILGSADDADAYILQRMAERPFKSSGWTEFDGETFYFRFSFAQYTLALSDLLNGENTLHKITELQLPNG